MSGEGRLCLVTPPAFEPAGFAGALAAALDAGGVVCVRLAMPGAGEEAIRRAADALRPVCAAREVALTLADDPRLAVELGLDGAHLGAGGAAALRAARALLGPDAILGAWGGATRHRAMVAAEAGADYVALGPIRADAPGDGAEAGAELFEWWDEMIETPSVAEGGLTPEIARALAHAADYFAPSRSVWEHPQGAAAGVRAYLDALAAAG